MLLPVHRPPTPLVSKPPVRVLRDAFDVEVGFSDHTNGTTAAVGATILGACWIEKHFTLSKDLPGPDHWFSMDPPELRVLVDSVREAEKMMGSSAIAPTPSELFGRRDFRLSCVAVRDLEAGVRLQSSDITFQRPGDGISPIYDNLLTGLRLTRAIKKGQKFGKDHFHD